MSNKEHLGNSAVPKMATIKDTVKLTGVSEYTLRRLVHDEKIVYIKVGNRVLVNVDRFIEYLNSGDMSNGGKEKNE